MPEFEEECKFEVDPAKIHFLTAKNGDKITMKSLVFSAEQAASIAWLINNNATLEVEIKVKE